MNSEYDQFSYNINDNKNTKLFFELEHCQPMRKRLLNVPVSRFFLRSKLWHRNDTSLFRLRVIYVRRQHLLCSALSCATQGVKIALLSFILFITCFNVNRMCLLIDDLRVMYVAASGEHGFRRRLYWLPFLCEILMNFFTLQSMDSLDCM